MNHFPTIDANRCFPVAEFEAKDFRISAALFDTNYLRKIGIPADTVKEYGRTMLLVEMKHDYAQSRGIFRDLYQEMPKNNIMMQVNRASGQFTVPTIFVYGAGAVTCLDTVIHKGVLTYQQAQALTAALEVAVHYSQPDESVDELRASHRPLPSPPSQPSQSQLKR